jgi:hypothetical protein
VDGRTRRIREFHPAVFALAPIGCHCDAALAAAGVAVHRHKLPFYLVDRSLPPLPVGLTDATAVRLIEPAGAVAARYNAERDGKRVPGGPVLVFVEAKGGVVKVLRRPTPSMVERGLLMIGTATTPAG